MGLFSGKCVVAEVGRIFIDYLGGNDAAFGDANDDDIPDLAVINEDSDDLSVLLGNGDGTFGPEQRYSLAPGDPDIDPWAVVIADIDDDGLQDLAVTNWWGYFPEPDLSVLFGTGGRQAAQSEAAPLTQHLHSAIAQVQAGPKKNPVPERLAGLMKR